MAGEIGLALALFGLSLGLRHGVDRDPIHGVGAETGSQALVLAAAAGATSAVTASYVLSGLPGW